MVCGIMTSGVWDHDYWGLFSFLVFALYELLQCPSKAVTINQSIMMCGIMTNDVWDHD